MALSNVVVLMLLSIVFYAQEAKAIRCYVCNSRIDASCDDELVPEKYVVTCDPRNAKAIEHPHGNRPTLSPLEAPRTVPFAPAGTNFTYCRKTKFSIPVQNNGNSSLPASTRVERSCGYVEGDANGCKWQTSFGGIQVLACKCEENSCNSVSLWTASGFFIFAVQAAVLPGVVICREPSIGSQFLDFTQGAFSMMYGYSIIFTLLILGGIPGAASVTILLRLSKRSKSRMSFGQMEALLKDYQAFSLFHILGLGVANPIFISLFHILVSAIVVPSNYALLRILWKSDFNPGLIPTFAAILIPIVILLLYHMHFKNIWGVIAKRRKIS